MRWTDTQDIAEELEARHPETNIITLCFADFRNWIVQLPEFRDDPESVSERILETIQGAWLELREGGNMAVA